MATRCGHLSQWPMIAGMNRAMNHQVNGQKTLIDSDRQLYTLFWLTDCKRRREECSTELKPEEMRLSSVSDRFLSFENELCRRLLEIDYSASEVDFIYNPIDYASEPHTCFLRKYCSGRKKVLFLGMNPGPFGMAQNGVCLRSRDGVCVCTVLVCIICRFRLVMCPTRQAGWRYRVTCVSQFLSIPSDRFWA